MSYKKIKELMVKTSPYTDKNGKRVLGWNRVGRMMYDNEKKSYMVYIHYDRLVKSRNLLSVDEFGYIRVPAFDPKPDNKSNINYTDKVNEKLYKQEFTTPQESYGDDDGNVPF